MRTVIVVEDEALIRMLAVEVLGDAGYRVVEFDNASDAIAFCTDPANDFTAVFTDVNMPGELDGLDVAQAVVDKRPGVAMVVTSGRYNVKPADLAAKVWFLPKPWKSADLVIAIGGATSSGLLPE